MVGSIFHFLYELTGKILIIGIIAPVNESVWEHTKLSLLPVIGWWLIFYLTKHYKYNIEINRWFTGMLVSLSTSIFLTILLFYFYTQAFGVELLTVDIIILLLADGVGQLLGYHIYKYSKGINILITITLAFAIIIIYIAWTVNPPHLPIFMDTDTGKYGI